MPKKILLADDSITIQKVVELTFSDGDYEVVAVNNGAKAIQKLSEMRPDIDAGPIDRKWSVSNGPAPAVAAGEGCAKTDSERPASDCAPKAATSASARKKECFMAPDYIRRRMT